MKTLLIATLLAALPLSAQTLHGIHQQDRTPNQAHTTAPYDFWFAKDGGGPLRISGPDSVTAYWLKLPKAGAAGCVIAGATDSDGAYPLSMGPCIVVGAHWSGSQWIADDSAAVVGHVVGSAFVLDWQKTLTLGAAISFQPAPFFTADLINGWIKFAKINGDLLSSVSNTIKIGDHAAPNYFAEGAFTTIYTDGVLPAVDDTSPVGSALHPMGDSYFHGLNVGAGGINLGDMAITTGHTLTINVGASINVPGSETVGGTLNLNGTVAFGGTVGETTSLTISGCVMNFIKGGLVSHSGTC